MIQLFHLENGAQIGYHISGKEHLLSGKRPLVLINGMSMTFHDWDALSVPLSRKRTILQFDHRDIGSSIVPSSKREKLSIELMARDAIALITSLGWQDLDVLGYSMGGTILQQILLSPALPFKISHVILAATTSKAPHGNPEFVALMTTPPPSSSSSPATLLTHAQKINAARKMAAFGYDPEWLSSQPNKKRVEATLESKIIARPSRVIAGQASAVRAFDSRPRLHLIPPSIKVLIIHGTLDQIISYKESSYLFKGIPHAKRVPLLNEHGGNGRRGFIPSEAYGHTWWDYFSVETWVGVLEVFLDDEQDGDLITAKL